MADLAYRLAALIAVLAVLGLWGLVGYGEMRKRQTEGQGVFVMATLVLYGLAPIAFWAAGTHRPHPDYTKPRAVTTLEGVVGRVSVMLLVGLLGVASLYFFSRRHRTALRGRPLWLGYMAFCAGPVLAMAGGTAPGLRYTFLLAPAAATTVYLSMTGDPERWTALVRRLLLIYLWSSIVVLIVRPEWGFETYRRATMFLGARPRLVGITATPNLLGPVAATALLLVVATSRGRWRWVNGAAACLVLLLTDSRMATVGAMAGLCCLFVHRREYGRGLRTLLVLSIVCVPTAVLLASNSPLERIAAVSEGSFSNRQVSTLSGRVDVWNKTMDAWEENRVFGYGPALWSPEYRQQFGERFSWVGQAHNQWIQTLGDSGLLGFVGLLIYVVALVRTALATFVRSSGLTLALVTLLLCRMLSESALRSPGLDVNTFLHLATLVVLMAYSRSDRDSLAPVVPPAPAPAASLPPGTMVDARQRR